MPALQPCRTLYFSRWPLPTTASVGTGEIMFKGITLLGTMLLPAAALHAQASPTAGRLVTAQAGVGFTDSNPDFEYNNIQGMTVYGTVEIGRHFGIEGEYHDLTFHTPSGVGERSYLLGARYAVRIKRFQPYLRGSGGLGSTYFHETYYPKDSTSLIYAIGFGSDFKVSQKINIRLFDAEYQRWHTFSPNGLNPSLYTVGVAYRFP